MKERIIKFLLENANSSIVLRVKKEVLKSLSKKEEEELLSNIILHKNIQTVIQSQKIDGWFGNSFHGQSPKNGAGMYDNMEVGLRYLAEKGFSPENEYIRAAIDSILLKEPFDSVYGGKPPKSPATDYTYTASGLYLARSSIIIRAGYECDLQKNDFIDLSHDIDFSFNTFTNVLNYKTTSEVIDTHRKKLCFKSNVMWPCIYHLRMLAHSQSWRNANNILLLTKSIDHLLSFKHSNEMVYTYINGQYVGPCFAFINQQIQILSLLQDEINNTSWFDTMELFARCGVVNNIEALRRKYEFMLSQIDDELNIKNSIDKRKGYGWSPYFGIALEEDWKDNIRMKCDLLFRILLIIHYTERI